MSTDSTDIWDELAGNDFRRVPEGEKGAGSPLVIPVDGGEPIRYLRATHFICAVEDDYGIAQWKRHLTVDGMLADSGLRVGWDEADWRRKVELTGIAFEQAGGYVKANNGTRMHAYTDVVDSTPEGAVKMWPAQYGPPSEAEINDLKAYQRAVADLTPVHVEVKVVNDALQVAGTPDRVWNAPGWAKPRIGDLKTGKFDARKCAMQMALYAHSRLYDVRTGQRTDLDVDLDVGLVVHLPYGEAKARVIEVDLVAGWEGVQLCAAVHAWRRRSGLSKAWTAPEPAPVDYVVLAQQAPSVEALLALHARAVADDRWDYMTKTAFTIRKNQLSGSAAA